MGDLKSRDIASEINRPLAKVGNNSEMTMCANCKEMSHLFEIVHIRQYTLLQIHSKHMELNMFLVLLRYGFDMIGEWR